MGGIKLHQVPEQGPHCSLLLFLPSWPCTRPSSAWWDTTQVCWHLTLTEESVTQDDNKHLISSSLKGFNDNNQHDQSSWPCRADIMSASPCFASGSMKRSLTAQGGDMHIYQPSPVGAMNVSGAGESLVTSIRPNHTSRSIFEQLLSSQMPDFKSQLHFSQADANFEDLH